MSPQEAKRLSLEYIERRSPKLSWIAESIGVKHQSMSQWVSGKHDPQDPTVWVQIATVLGIYSPSRTEVEEIARANLLRKLSERN